MRCAGRRSRGSLRLMISNLCLLVDCKSKYNYPSLISTLFTSPTTSLPPVPQKQLSFSPTCPSTPATSRALLPFSSPTSNPPPTCWTPTWNLQKWRNSLMSFHQQWQLCHRCTVKSSPSKHTCIGYAGICWTLAYVKMAVVVTWCRACMGTKLYVSYTRTCMYCMWECMSVG